MNEKHQKINTYDAVETAIDRSKTDKNVLWERLLSGGRYSDFTAPRKGHPTPHSPACKTAG